MERTTRQVVLATVAVLVIAVAAATLPNPVAEGGGGATPGSDSTSSDSGIIGSSGGGFNFEFGSEDLGFKALCFPFLLSPWFIWGMLISLLGFTILLYRRTDLFATVGALGFFLTPGILVYILLTDCRPPQETTEAETPLPEYNISFLFEGGGGGGGPGTQAVPTASPTFLLLMGVIAVAVLFVFLRATGDDDLIPEEAMPEEPEAESSLAAVGEAAGRAADRLEGRATVENEVYRAWQEMTDLLAFDRPETATPGEFAERARAEGMDPEHVEELTDLFRGVRYGGKEPTPDRETRAIETLREIESVYGEEDEDADT